MLEPGDLVEHRELGPGCVVGRVGGRLKVRFRRLVFDVLLRERELVPLEPVVGAPAPRRPPRDYEPTIEEQPASHDAWERRVIEACRFGILDSEYARELTVGREAELESFTSALDATGEGGGACGVTGDYGSGKTHLLTLMADRARRAGFLTSLVTIDPLEIRPCNPKRLYRSIVTQLRYPDRAFGDEGLAPLLDRVASEEHWGRVSRRFLRGPFGGGGHRYLHALLLFWFSQRRSHREEHAEWANGALAWIEGQDEASGPFLRRWIVERGMPRAWFPALPDHRTRSHTYTYLLTGIAQLAREVGYRGLVILIDEAEYHERLGGADRIFAEDFFARLLYAALRPQEGPLAEWEKRSYRGGHQEAKQEPTAFTFPHGLVPVIAATPGTRVAHLLESFLPPEACLPIHPLGTREIQQLIARIGNLYWNGYRTPDGDRLPPSRITRDRYRNALQALGQWARDWMNSGAEDVVRPVIRATTHVLDLVRYGRIPPPRSGADLATLLEGPDLWPWAG